MTYTRVQPIFSKESEATLSYLEGKKGLEDPKRAESFVKSVGTLNIKHLPVPTEQEFKSMTPEQKKLLVEGMWDRFYLTTAKPLNNLPL